MSFKPSAKKRHVKTGGLGRSNLVKAYTVDVNRTKTKKMFNDRLSTCTFYSICAKHGKV